jgi:hydroxypyruvate reductase
MLSGGGSAIAEKPIDNEISLDDLIATYRALVLSGAPIAEINAVRKHLSAVKGGRLALAAYPAKQVSLMISDVPDHTLDALASGPTMPDSTSIADCYAVVEKYKLMEQFPGSVRELFQRHALEETPKSDDPAFVSARWWPVLSNKTAVDEAGVAATREGFAVEVDNSCDDWDYARAADYLLGRLGDLRKNVSRVCLISGGEVTVKVTNGGSRYRSPQSGPSQNGRSCGGPNAIASSRARSCATMAAPRNRQLPNVWSPWWCVLTRVRTGAGVTAAIASR